MFKPGQKPGMKAPAAFAPKKPSAPGPKKPKAFNADEQMAKAKALRNVVPKGPKEMDHEGAAKTVD